MKKFFITVAAVICLYTAFLTVDCIRLRYSESYTEPFVTVDSYESKNRVSYTGLGYSVKYYTDNGESGDCYGAEFRLFDKIMVWAWIE